MKINDRGWPELPRKDMTLERAYDERQIGEKTQ